jgi:hypothetical protein
MVIGPSSHPKPTTPQKLTGSATPTIKVPLRPESTKSRRPRNTHDPLGGEAPVISDRSLNPKNGNQDDDSEAHNGSKNVFHMP